jgi:phage shock protein PspC (stress-responsive transcriptional regulator)
MNKTLNINLGGLFFHIDEDAFQKLTRYFEAIKQSLSNTSGQDEIINDIEMRIGELISEKHINDKQVISLKEVEDVIAIMGQPEDYRIDNDEPTPKQDYVSEGKISRKLYRDTENGMVGGVLAGLGHYFGIDKVWLRVFLLLLVLAWGTGVLAYIILWIVMPEAKTTTEKLEMRGQPVTISTIEKKVREEIEALSEKYKSTDFEKMKSEMKTGGEKLKDSLGEILNSIFRILAKIIGAFLVLSSLAILIVFLIGVITLGTVHFPNFPFHDFIASGNFTDYPIWFFSILLFVAIAIPCFFILLLGFRLLSPNLKSIGPIAKYSLIGIWSIALGLLISVGVQQASEFAYKGRVYEKQSINLKVNDTLLIRFKHNDYFAKDAKEYTDFEITKDSMNQNVIYSNSIAFEILKTDEKLPYLQINKEAKGKSFIDAKQRAEKIKYGFRIDGNQLLLDNYLLSELKDKFRGQEIQIKLFLKKGTLFKVDSNVKNFDYSDNNFFNLHYSSEEYIYRVEDNQIKCLNCPITENEFEDSNSKADTIETTTVSVKVNGEEVIINETIRPKTN